MISVREITSWDWSNHTYFLDDSQNKLLGYQVDGEKPVTFTTPMDFDKRGRKFEVIKADTEKNTRIIQGSKGNVYYITNVNGVERCTCTGFKYHGKCKHIKEAV